MLLMKNMITHCVEATIADPDLAASWAVTILAYELSESWFNGCEVIFFALSHLLQGKQTQEG